MTRRPRTSWAGLGVGLLSGVLALLAWATQSIAPLERLTWSARQQWLAQPGDDRIILVLLDQPSLDWGKSQHALAWPWPRELYAMALDYLRDAGAQAVAVDILFTEPSAMGHEDDLALGQSIARWPSVVPAMLPSHTIGDADHWPAGVRPQLPLAEALPPGSVANPHPSLVASRAVFSLPDIVGQAFMQGHVRATLDDRLATHIWPVQIFDGQIVPLLGLAVHALNAEQPQAQPAITLSAKEVRIGSHTMPLDAQGRAILRYPRAGGQDNPWPYRAVSMKDVLESALRVREGQPPVIDPALFKDRYVMIGFSAPALYDAHATPLSPNTPGIVIHATALDNLLNDNAIVDGPAWLFVIVILAITLLAGWWSATASGVKSVLIVALALLPVILAMGVIAYMFHVWWPVAAPLGGVMLALAGGFGINYVTLGRQRRFIKQAFEHYLSPQVIAQLIDNPDRLKLGGQRRELTILFADLAGFSSISETLDPQTLTTLLNDYLSDMTDLVLAHGGTLDKYEGDAFIAFWNAPVDQPDHAARAVRTALACQQKLREKQADFARIAGRPVAMRIGINTGAVVVGNMGSATRFDYTVLGDAANLASRLEGANKAFHTAIMVSQATRDSALAHDDTLIFRPIASITVVGKSQPVQTWEPLSPDCPQAQPDRRANFEQAMARVTQGQWREAHDLLTQQPDDALAELWRNRLAPLRDQPADAWTGVWPLTAK